MTHVPEHTRKSNRNSIS